jgi:hypothetical protein
VALGASANAGHTASVAIGLSATTTAANQIRLGTATEDVNIPGTLTLGTEAVTGAWGTWTPTVTQSGSVTVTITEARYKKIGRTVYLRANLSVTGSGTGANPVVIGGLPYTAQQAEYVEIGVGHIFDFSAGDDFTGIVRFRNTNNTLEMLNTRANGTLGSSGFTAGLAASDIVSFSGHYEASA